MGLGPVRGRTRRASALRALLPCLALTALAGTHAAAQTLTPDMFRPMRGGFVTPQDSPLRPTSDRTGVALPDSASDPRLGNPDTPAPSRVGRIPTYGFPPPTARRNPVTTRSIASARN